LNRDLGAIFLGLVALYPRQSKRYARCPNISRTGCNFAFNSRWGGIEHSQTNPKHVIFPALRRNETVVETDSVFLPRTTGEPVKGDSSSDCLWNIPHISTGEILRRTMREPRSAFGHPRRKTTWARCQISSLMDYGARWWKSVSSQQMSPVRLDFWLPRSD